MLPSSPPPTNMDIIDDRDTTTDNTSSNNRKNSLYVFAIFFAGTMLTTLVVALYLAFGLNGVSEVTGAAGSTPGKVLIKLKSQSLDIKLKKQTITQDDVMAVRNGTQKIPMDWKILWSGSREKAGAKLGGVNGQNSRSYNGSKNEEIFNNQQTIQSPNNTAHSNNMLHRLLPIGRNIPISQKADNNSKNSNGLPPLVQNLNKNSQTNKNVSLSKWEHPLVPNINLNGNKSKNNSANQQPIKNTRKPEWEHPLVQIPSPNGKQSTHNITKQPNKNSQANTFEHTLAPPSYSNGKFLNQPKKNGWEHPLVALNGNGKATGKNITIPVKASQKNTHPLVPIPDLNGYSSTQPPPDRNPQTIQWASPSPIVPIPSPKGSKLSNFPINHPSNKNSSPNSRWLPIIPVLSPIIKKPNMHATSEKP